ncbi:MAG: arsenate reductase (glutaredoxin) [Xanthomonadales bacterium]|jgi:arsenate reductase|nr:arsenate reductase (glutaredoxin) [Xanthomonadales bacterium]
MTIRIYHNPRCSKSRATLALLEERGIEPDIVRYLDDPPSVEEIQSLLTLLDRSPGELARRGEDAWRELGLADADDETILEAMASHPKLIERPIVVNGDRAALGRPPEAVLDIL